MQFDSAAITQENYRIFVDFLKIKLGHDLGEGQEYLIEKDEPKKLVLSCASSADVKEVFWYINNVFLQKCQSAESTFFIPENGSHKISCCDDKGRNTDIHIMVTYY
jgi:membrane carboxypeptidase/penicillin-binding protein PbpC